MASRLTRLSRVRTPTRTRAVRETTRETRNKPFSPVVSEISEPQPTVETSAESVDPATAKKPQLLGCSFDELQKQLTGLNIPKYRASQVFTHLYKEGITDWSNMITLPKAVRTQLGESINFELPQVAKEERASDGTRKWLLNVRNGELEMVHIPMPNEEATLCISSQVGCALSCTFCRTGAMDKTQLRNLETHEIIGQVHQARFATGLRPNIVFMGMGEPLLNLRNVRNAVSILTDPKGFGFSGRHITVSTSGIVPAIEKLIAGDFHARLAVSLHAPNDSLRNELVPINKTYPLASLIEVCSRWKFRRVTFEYVMLKGVNDTPELARDLGRLLKSSKGLVNLIPFNPWEGSNYETSDASTIDEFKEIVTSFGLPVTVRVSKGREINAACGQLATKMSASRLNATNPSTSKLNAIKPVATKLRNTA